MKKTESYDSHDDNESTNFSQREKCWIQKDIEKIEKMKKLSTLNKN